MHEKSNQLRVMSDVQQNRMSNEMIDQKK